MHSCTLLTETAARRHVPQDSNLYGHGLQHRSPVTVWGGALHLSVGSPDMR